jgi:survival-of-motor-neuron-related-splicing factor 30
MIRLIDDSIAELKPKNEPAKAPSKKDPSPAPVEQKWSRENHPAFKKAAPAEEKEKEKEPEIITYQVNDNVMAKWVSGDKGFYPARITSVTGSSTAPIYTVKFKSYDTVETLRAKDIRPVAQKRKADGTAVSTNSIAIGGATASTTVASPSSLTPTASNNGIVLSAAADMYPQAQAANKAAVGNNDEKPRPKFKKIKATKELEAGKNKWQEFTSKGKVGKAVKKESMFRTPEGAHGRGRFFFVNLYLHQKANIRSQSASQAQASLCARIQLEPAMSISPMKIWTRLTRGFFILRDVVTAWSGSTRIFAKRATTDAWH